MSGLLCESVRGVRISGTGAAFAPGGHWIENEDIHALLHGPDWRNVMAEQKLEPHYFEERHGFVRRHWTHVPGEPLRADEPTSADLMTDAARTALEQAGLHALDVSLFIAVSTTSHRYTSSLGTLVSGRLGLQCAAFEMKSGCSSSLYALTVAYRFLAGGAQHVLIAAGETLSRVLPLQAPLLYSGGDGGGAIILSRTHDDDSGLLAAYLHSDGTYAHDMGVPGHLPPLQAELDAENYYMAASPKIAEAAKQHWPESAQAVMQAAALSGDDVDLYVPHQVNRDMIYYGAGAAGIAREKVFDCLDRYANCGSGTVLIALAEAQRAGRWQEGSTLLLNAVGGGLAWGGLLLRA